MGGFVLQKRRLGNTNIEVSVIGLGTVKFGRNQGVKYPTSFELPSDKEAMHLLNQAAELGINLLDTAPAYGASEERLGHLLKGHRSNWVMTTKVGEEFVDGKSYFDFSKQAVQRSIERSLKRLHTDYLDIVLVHSNGEDKRIIEEEGIFEVLSSLKQDGKIRAYGMSTKTIEGGLLTIEKADVAMVTFNPQYVDERKVIVHAHQQQKGIFIKKAFASGTLLQSSAVAQPSYSADQAMQFIFAEPGVTSVIIGTINPHHLRENCSRFLASTEINISSSESV